MYNLEGGYFHLVTLNRGNKYFRILPTIQSIIVFRSDFTSTKKKPISIKKWALYFFGLRTKNAQLHTKCYPFNAAAPLTISVNSVVIAAWRAWLYESFKAFNNSPAFSVALSIDVIRAPCSEA